MDSILEKIVASKRKEVKAKSDMGIFQIYEKALSDVVYTPLSMSKALADSQTGIISEFKRRSPSRHEIAPSADPSVIVPGYQEAGATACSILTDTPFFGGALSDLAVARKNVTLPLLRKEFIIDPGQIFEARVFGADAILLIAAILSASEIKELTDTAHGVGLEVLLEIHNEQEIDKIYPAVDMIGINNRDLTTFKVDIATSKRLGALLPENKIKVSESGIHSTDEIKELQAAGFKGFLLGQAFMETSNPPEALGKFIKAF